MQSPPEFTEKVQQIYQYLASHLGILLTLAPVVIALLALLLNRRSQIESRARDESRDKDAKELEERMRTEAKYQVPNGFGLSNEVLCLPSMEEAGIPEVLSHLGIFEHKVEPGRWVTHGEVLLTVHYKILWTTPAPRRWFNAWGWFGRGETEMRSVDLESPVAGLVISYHQERVGFKEIGRVWYDKHESFPIILLPQSAVPPDQTKKYFYSRLNDMLKNPRIGYQDADGDWVRFYDRFPDLKLQIVKDLTLSDLQTAQIEPCDEQLLNAIQQLRRKSPHLHSKLSHLVS